MIEADRTVSQSTLSTFRTYDINTIPLSFYDHVVVLQWNFAPRVGTVLLSKIVVGRQVIAVRV
jgi:hypothetical protein